MDNPVKTTVRRLTVSWPLATFLLLSAVAHAETAVQAWVQRYNGPHNCDAYATAGTVDGESSVILTGYLYNGGLGYATIKYSSAGVPLWTNYYHGVIDYDFAKAVVADADNNVVVTGQSKGFGSSYDYLTIKYSSVGVALWTNSFNGPGNGDDYGLAVAADGNQNVIVTGGSTGSGSGLDYATIKYSSVGVPLWTNRYDGPVNGADYAAAVAVDSDNSVVVTGQSRGLGSGYDYATIKYSSAGVPLWTNRYNAPGNTDDIPAAVAVDSQNCVIVSGYTQIGSDYSTIKYSRVGVPLWTNHFSGPKNSSITPAYGTPLAVDSDDNVLRAGCSFGIAGVADYETIKYSSEGFPLWANPYNGPGNPIDLAYATAVDGSNNVLVTGNASGDYATIKYSSAGVPLWTNRYNGPGNNWDDPCAVAVDRGGNVIVTGSSTGSGGSHSFTTIKYICVPSPVMTALQLTNCTFQLRVDDVLQPGTLVIEATTNLAGWAPVFTNTTPTNVLFYTDPDASNSPARFYRALQFP
jgi:hypothetical protein